MRFRARKTSAKLTLFSRFCPTDGATNCQGQFLFRRHSDRMHHLPAIRWSIVTSLKVQLSVILAREKFQPALVLFLGHVVIGPHKPSSQKSGAQCHYPTP